MFEDLTTAQGLMMLFGGLAVLYAGAWVASRAYFDNKEQYNKRLIRSLEEKK